MTARGVVAAAQRPVLEEIRTICEQIDPEAAAQLGRYTPGGLLPSPIRRREEYDLFVSEALLILARAVRGKRRGRKPNVVFHEKDSQAK